MLIPLGPSETIAIGQSAGESSGWIGDCISDLCGENASHGRNHRGVIARSLHGSISSWSDLSSRGGAQRRRLPLHGFADALEKIGIRQGQADGDRDFVQLPDFRFHLHPESGTGHEWSSLRLTALVGLKRQLNVVLITPQGIILHNYFDSLTSLRIF